MTLFKGIINKYERFMRKVLSTLKFNISNIGENGSLVIKNIYSPCSTQNFMILLYHITISYIDIWI